MKIKVWSVTTNDDSGVATEIFADEAAAKASFAAWVEASWKEMWSLKERPIPDDREAAYDTLCNTIAFLDTIHVKEHEIEMPAFGPVAIAVEGGAIQSVVTDDTRLTGADVLVIDYDIDGADRTYKVPQRSFDRAAGGWAPDGESDATLYDVAIGSAHGIDLADTWRRFTEEVPAEEEEAA